jgi:hypothetical protein
LAFQTNQTGSDESDLSKLVATMPFPTPALLLYDRCRDILRFKASRRREAREAQWKEVNADANT